MSDPQTTNGAAAAAEAAKSLEDRINALMRSRRRNRIGTAIFALVALVALGAALSARSTSQAQSRADDRAADADRRAEAETVERRVISRGLDYARCTDGNLFAISVDAGFQTVLAPGLANPEGNRVGLSRLLDGLRGNLTLADCEATLAGLTPDEASRARIAAANTPRRPLPPPSVPGYVPPNIPTPAE